MIRKILSRKALFMAAAAILMAAAPATTLHAQEKSEQQQIAESTLVKVGAAKTVKAFLQKNGYKFPAGLDPEQAIYKRYASNFIPRNFVIDKQGKIAYLSVGYDEKEFAELIDTVATQLKK